MTRPGRCFQRGLGQGAGEDAGIGMDQPQAKALPGQIVANRLQHHGAAQQLRLGLDFFRRHRAAAQWPPP